jgi:hypothetical protein
MDQVYTQEALPPPERCRKLARLTHRGEELVSLVVDSVRQGRDYLPSEQTKKTPGIWE